MDHNHEKLIQDGLVTTNLDPETYATVLKIRQYLLNGSIFSNHLELCLKGTSAFDMGILLLVIEELDERATTVLIHEICGTSLLTIKNWIERLRNECMCEVKWVKQPGRCKGNSGQFVVYSWGIFNRAVYLPFKPYVKLLVKNSRVVIDNRREEVAKEKERVAKLLKTGRSAI